MRLIDADVLIKHLMEVMITANEFGNIERVSEIGGCIGVVKGEKTIEPPTVAFLCKDKGTEYCHHTKHIEQARNFEKVGPNQWMEKEPKRGKWTEEFDESANPFFQRRWRCSACNDYNYYGRPDFCPCCGADMRKEGDGK